MLSKIGKNYNLIKFSYHIE